jgi:DNA polymerase III epsilon subunit-like protein
MEKVIIFDTETTGLIPKNINIDNLNEDILNGCPYIIQFGFISYDIEENKLLSYSNKYVLLDLNVDIPIESISIHKITKEIINKNKPFDIEVIIEEFMSLLNKSDKLIGHNISFDINMLKIEIMRLYYKTKNTKWINYFDILKNKNIYCTMMNTINICNIKIIRYGKEYNKYPKLIELYRFLFNKNLYNLHDALNDCFCCLRCYIKIVYDYDVTKKNKSIKEIFNLLS